MSLIMYLFGLVFLQAVLAFYQSGSSDSASEELQQTLEEKYGSIQRVLLTLFSSVSGGINWADAMSPLGEISTLYVVFFCMFIMVTYHGILHVMTGIFVDSAMMASRTDRDEAIADEMSEKDSYMAQMRDLLLEGRAHHSGSISMEEFEVKLKDERMQTFLKALELDASEARGYFSLLDTEGLGTVTVQEFVVGCFRLKGQTKGLDLANVMHENKKLTRIFTKFMHSSEMQYDQINEKMQIICQHLQGKTLDF